jgi:UDP-2,4-diacetamido-2,4,6-trideoxy-beta-L-altropyranose hydrolase
MRCLALAQQWQRQKGSVLFVSAEITAALEQRLKAESMETSVVTATPGSIEDAEQTIAHARACGASWVVADGYVFGAAWQKRIKDSGLRLLVIDDYGHAEHYHADIVLNQNASADAQLYTHRDASTRLLLGTRYALLRQEFIQWRDWKRVIPQRGTKVLVTLGGSDPDNITSAVIEALAKLPDAESIIVAGGSNPHLVALKKIVAQHASTMRLEVNATNMPELMAWADIAVSAAGSTSWELAYMRLPSALIVTASNQAKIAKSLSRAGVITYLGSGTEIKADDLALEIAALLKNNPRRIEMSVRGGQLVDGHGGSRITAALKSGLTLSIVSDANTWLNPFLPGLKCDFEKSGHAVRWIHDPRQIESGDVAFFLSLSQIVPDALLKRNAHNLVVHESALPQGRGWSPLTWQILEGKTEIPVSLIEAGTNVDSGEIFSQESLKLRGTELIDELRATQAKATISLCQDFIARYPYNCSEGRTQIGNASYYPRRRPEDSRLDLDKSLREQFNLLRVADPDRYPAFFEIDGQKFDVRLIKRP